MNQPKRHHSSPSETHARFLVPSRPAPVPEPDPEVSSGAARAFERFLKYLEALSARPTTSLAKQLITDGISLPAAGGLDDAEVHEKLWEVIEGVARRQTYLYHTDHLSDRQLYTRLWESTLNDPEHDIDGTTLDYAIHIDLIGDGCADSQRIYLQYYADEMDRAIWQEDAPHTRLPDILPPPYDRDQFLPRPDLEFPY